MSIETLFPLVVDIIDAYKLFRRRGETREVACQHVIDDNAKELLDEDDGPMIWIGLAKITGAKGELTEELYNKAELAFNKLEETYPEYKNDLLKAKQKICNRNLIGKEAKYSRKRQFKPDWQIGDTFLAELRRKEPPLENKVVLLRKVDEALDCNDNWEQILYLSICDKDRLPKTNKDLNSLGYIPGHYQNQQYGFRLTITATSQKVLDSFHLTKLGCFPDIQHPIMEDKDDLPYPLFPCKRPSDASTLDHYVYLNFRRYGVHY